MQPPISEIDAAFAEIASRLRTATVQVFTRGGHGSGLVASPDGTIVTNAHVARGRHARVVLHDGDERRGEIVAAMPERDLALISVNARDLAAAPLGDSRRLRTGDLVIAAGNPLDLVGAVTAGIVHTADPRGRRVVADLVLQPGNSGGPLADASGAVVGINAMVVDGLAVAISSVLVRRFIAAPDARPYLGVVTTAAEVQVMGARRTSALVVEVVDRSSAARAGILPGDAVIGVNGRLFADADDLLLEIDASDVGQSLRLDIVRAGRVHGIDVVVGDAGARAAAA